MDPALSPKTSAALDAIYDDDELVEGGAPPPQRWHIMSAVLAFTTSGAKTLGPNPHIAGHAANFLRERGYLLKTLTRSEGTILEELQREPSLRPFVPQFMEYVDRDGVRYIKMQDVLLSMVHPNVIDLKMGVRTFAEEEVTKDKRRMDLLEKALIVQSKCPDVHITDDEKQHGMTKYRFMALRDSSSSTAALGFRGQGMKAGARTQTSKDFAGLRTTADYGPLFDAFFEKASPSQRQALVHKLRDLRTALQGSAWFARHEVIGTSLLVAYDTQNHAKCGLWLIDFARTEPAPTPLVHSVPWTPGSHEDGFLLGVDSLLSLWDVSDSSPSPPRAP